MREKNQSNFPAKTAAAGPRREVPACALCEGELYPGDRYFAMDGQNICETCLERYARRYFAGQLRRVERNGGGAE